MNYSQIREQDRNYAAVGWDFPYPGYSSLPIPTKRWSFPAYAYFVSPAGALYNQPYRIYSPKGWWAVQAEGDRLLFYAQTRAIPFVDANPTSYVELREEGETRTIQERKQQLLQMEKLMDPVVEAFFADQPAEREMCQQASQALFAAIPKEVHPWHQALGPDFFAWLKA